MSGRIVLFAKAPRPGRVKTRLAATHGDEFAVALARASLLDTWSTLAPYGEPVLAWDGEKDEVPFEARVIPQGDGDLGAPLERVLRDQPDGAEWVMAVGSDSPGLPRQLLASAVAALADHDAAIGPADDGGFYLLALRAHGLRVHELSPWFDVDVAADVDRLRDAIASGEVEAPNVEDLLGRHATGSPGRKPGVD